MSFLVVPYDLASKKVAWVKRDVLLFAVSIGCTVDELHFLYELHPDFTVFPTYPVVLPYKLADQEVTDYFGRSALPQIPGLPRLDPKRGVDGERKLTIFKPLPAASTGKAFELRSRVVGVYDKGKAGTIIQTEQSIVDGLSNEVYSRALGSSFFIGQGNWGGPKGVLSRENRNDEPCAPAALTLFPHIEGPISQEHSPPSDKPVDARFEVQTNDKTAYLYRLNGDYNPLHAAPDLGTKMDFGGTILHGLYSWNAVAHGIVQKLASSNPRALREFSARFASPVKPGDTLITEAWVLGEGEDGFEEVRFVTKNQNDKPVLSNGRALLRRRFDSSKI